MRPVPAVKSWTHAPGPDGGTRCGKGSEGRDVLARAGEATCPDCRASLDLRIFVGAVLWTPHHARATRGRLAVTVRELRDFLVAARVSHL